MNHAITEKFFGTSINKPAQVAMPKNGNSQNKITELINNVLKDKSKKIALIERLSPVMALKVIPGNTIEKVFSSLYNIDPEKIDLKAELRYQGEQYYSENIFETKSKSMGLSQADLDLSFKILRKNCESINYDLIKKNGDNNSKKSSKIYCILSIKVILFRIVIPKNEIKLTNKISEELEKAEKSQETNRKIILENLTQSFGLYVPLELLIGGRINYSFEANNNDEIKEIDSLLKNDIKSKFGNCASFFSGFKFSVGGMKNDSNNKYVKKIDTFENININMEGGNYKDINNYQKWINSINMDNIQIVEYQTLTPIYDFVPELRPKLDIILKKKYNDIVLEEIKNLIENDYIKKEHNLLEGSSENSNSWSVGITEEKYKSFIILTKQFSHHFKNYQIIENENNVSICGNIPDGFIICGWEINTNANSAPYNIICKWKRNKEPSIIGSFCFKFEVDIITDNNINDLIDIDIILDIYCIHEDFLIPYDQTIFNKCNSNDHYFLNCDCCQKTCYYNDFYKNKNWKKLNEEKYYKLMNDLEDEEKKLKEENNQSGVVTNIFNNIVNIFK
jgi:hypothetical protein